MTLNVNPFAAHHLIASLIGTIHRMIMKHPQNRTARGISIFAAGRWSAGETCKDADRAAVKEQYLPIYHLFLFLSTTWKYVTIRLQNPTENW